MQDNFEQKLKGSTEKFLNHNQNWKKIRALVNFSKTLDDFEEWNALEFIVRYFIKGFLDPEQEQFLDYVIRKYAIDYLQWCHLTLWVKNQISSKEPPKPAQQLYFWFPDYESKKISDRFKYPVYSKLERYKQIQLEAL